MSLQQSRTTTSSPAATGTSAALQHHPSRSIPSLREYQFPTLSAVLRGFDDGLADNLDEIASPMTHPESRTFDDRAFEDERVGIDIGAFTALFERHSGHTIEGLRSPLRDPQQVRARIEFATVAAARCGIRSTDVADSIRKHPTTIARLIRRGRNLLLEDRSFREHIDSLDHRISSFARNDPEMP